MLSLQVKDLTKIFRSRWSPLRRRQEFVAVNKLSFDVAPAEILGFLGPNGAGKTTTIHMLLGVLTPTSGSIFYWGKDFLKHRIKLLERISCASGFDKLPARLTIIENLDIIGRMYNLSYPERRERIKSLMKSFDIWDMRDKETGLLSAGQSTRVMLTKAFLSNPDIVLLDEPTAALDPDVADFVRKFVLEQRKERGISFLFTSHNMDEVTQVCDRVLVVKKGIVIANDKPEALARSIAHAKIHIIIEDNQEQLVHYLRSQNIHYEIEAHEVKIEIEEHKIAPFLMGLADQKIHYSHISIDKPSLEDYFLTIAKQK